MMLRRMAWVAVLLFAMAALSTAADELVVFTDYRALIVTSHRVEGDWTYLRIGSGEMAVPTVTILKFDQEQGVSLATAARASASPQAPARPYEAHRGQPPMIPAPFNPASPGAFRPPQEEPPQVKPEEDEEDVGSDEEEESGIPAEAMPPPQPPSNLRMMPPGQNPIQKAPPPGDLQQLDRKD